MRKVVIYRALLLISFPILFIIYDISAEVIQKPNHKEIVNGAVMYDVTGKVINAHGGGFIKVGDYYYWLGENRKDGVLVSCYRSKDLVNWEFRGDLLTRNSSPELKHANIERPKVIYNAKTKKYVMWMHYEYGGNYNYARAAVAISDNIEKPFKFLRSFRPFGNMSRDCTLFKDTDGKAYFFSAARNNYDMMMYQLTDNYLDVKKQIATLWPGGHREAPAVVKGKKYYYMITSACTGWAPNQARYAYAKSITGPWSNLIRLGDSVTYNSQSTYILPIQGKETTSYLYVGDRWDAKNYFNSRYVFLPLIIKGKDMKLNWVNKVSPDVKTGRIIVGND